MSRDRSTREADLRYDESYADPDDDSRRRRSTMSAGGGTVLVVDDEQRLRDLVRHYLEREGFSVVSAADGHAALDLARAHEPDVVVLDLMLPGLDGLEVCRRLRGFSDAYVIMLTARSEEIDRVVGLEVGADDYVTKPFSPRELVARVRAMLRRPRGGDRSAPAPAQTLRFGDLAIDQERRVVTRGVVELALTSTEWSLLVTLAAHPGRVWTRAALLEQVWGPNYFGDDHVVDVHIANLRKKLGDDPAAPRFIGTVRGVGYRFTEQAA
jgi:two-component system, OmpR family, alkaline phosphatase synthesis response regulator PhoP